MPAWRLDDQPRELQHFDVGAMDGTAAAFIMHVALCLVDHPTIINKSAKTLRTVHMGPPLGEVSLSVDVIATAHLDPPDLPAAERRQIKVFVDDRFKERKAQEERLKRLQTRQRRCAEYVIHPPYLEPTGDIPLWRFSCSGFVLKAYEEANINLIDQGNLPPIPLTTLKDAYPQWSSFLEDAEVRKVLGIGEGSEWPVVLAGYIVNSLDRPADDIRKGAFVPEREDAYFPKPPPTS